MASTILEVCDAIVAGIQGRWTPTAPDAVERAYAPTVNDADFLASPETLEGLHVYVMPGSSELDDPGLSRGTDAVDHEVFVLTVQRYLEQGAPPKAWTDELVAFVRDNVWEPYRSRKKPAVLPGVLPWKARWEIFDYAQMRGKLFWSEVTLTLRDLKA